MPLVLTGATSGSTTLQSTDAVTNTLTLPASTGTLHDENSTLLSSKLSGALPAIDGSALTGISGGKVLQVVSTTSTTVVSTTSTSYVDVTDLTLSITPSSATSKILVIASVNYSSSSTSDNALFRLMRDAVSIGNGASGICFGGRMGTTAGVQTGSINHLDSPATTSATTYKFQFKSGANTARVNERGDTGFDYSSHITLMEIGA